MSGPASLRIKVILAVLASQIAACDLTGGNALTSTPTDEPPSLTVSPSDLSAPKTPVPLIGTGVPQASPTPTRNVTLWVTGINDHRQAIIFSFRASCLDEAVICVMDGQQATTWPTLISDLEWSSEGDQLAIVAGDPETNESEIYILDADHGWAATVITRGVTGHATSPYWSSDGQRLTFALATEHTDEICEYDVATGQIARDVLPIQGLSGIGSVSQSPSGTWAFHAFPAGSPSASVFLYSSSVGLNQVAPSGSSRGSAAGPRFSRDGQYISYVQQTIDLRGNNVMVMSMDGTNVVDITHDDAVTNSIAWWSPVSDHLAYLSTRDTGDALVAELWVSDLSGVQRAKIATPADIGVVTILAAGWRIVP